MNNLIESENLKKIFCEKKVRPNGFTLIELMIVVVVIGILAAVALPKFSEMVSKSREATIRGQLASLRSAISIYYSDTQTFPNDLSLGLTAAQKYYKEIPNPSIPSNTINANPGHPASTSGIANIEAGNTLPAEHPEFYWFFYNSGPEAGQILVNCTHGDTKGSVWTSY